VTDERGYHQPVLLREVVNLLRHAKSVLDGTLGGGGHSLALLESGVDHVTGVDRDPDALRAARVRLDQFEREGRFMAVQANYADIESVDALREARFDGILLDLGISSRQVDDSERGFTFREGAPLDMRMGEADRTAADLLNENDERELADIFHRHGDERRAGRLAREVVKRRQSQSFRTSDDFVKAIRGALGPRTGPSDFARLFQALRIVVNDEIGGLERALPVVRGRLNAGGVLAVITYHSGEDRIVKHAFRDWSTECSCPPRQPMCTCRGHALGTTLTRKAVTPDAAELAGNSRARSAKLRAWQAA
jgi:16S rRNA (cytosine1402-N4)-methyltransferase